MQLKLGATQINPNLALCLMLKFSDFFHLPMVKEREETTKFEAMASREIFV